MPKTGTKIMAKTDSGLFMAKDRTGTVFSCVVFLQAILPLIQSLELRLEVQEVLDDSLAASV